MKVTIKEVAKKAGVSISTVSRVFNNTAFVDEDKKKLILNAAKELHYVPNQIARLLIKQNTNTIGVILPGLYGEYYSQLIKGMDNVASNNNYDFLISNINRKNLSIKKNIRFMIGLVDGLIIMSPGINEKEIEENIPSELPIIFFNSFEANEKYDSINVNNFYGTKAIVNHLINHGHKNIAIIKGVEKSFDSIQRYEGYLSALLENNLIDHKLEFEGNFSIESGYGVGEIIKSLQKKPTAIFASNDAMAIGLISALKDSEIRVPDDIAVVGFDDIPMAQYSTSRLTTVKTDLHSIGANLMQRILYAVTNKVGYAKQQIVLPYEVIIRESCGIH